MKQTKRQGRPKTYEDSTVVCVSGAQARTKLQDNSERKAIVRAVLDAGGRASIAALVDQFGYDVRPKIFSLIVAGWLDPLEVEQ